MSYFIPRGLRSEIKLVSTIRFSIFLKDVAFFSVWVCIFYFFQFLVSPWLVVPYWCLCAISGFYLVRQARRSNPEKRNWEAILLMAGKDHKVYRSFDSHILQAEPAEVPTPSASQGVLSLDIDPDAVPHHGKPKKQKNKKTKKNTSKVPAIDHTVLEAFPIRFWKIVSREGEKGYFLLEDGSILDIFQITGRSYLHASREEAVNRQNGHCVSSSSRRSAAPTKSPIPDLKRALRRAVNYTNQQVYEQLMRDISRASNQEKGAGWEAEHP